MPKTSLSAVIAAAGSATRFGGIDQLKEKIGGKSVLSHALDIFEADEDCIEVIVAASPEVRSWIKGDPLTFASGKLKLMDGGATRAESVALAVRAAAGEIVAIHDGNRPNCGAGLLDKLKATVLPERGAVPGVPLTDACAYITSIGDGQPVNGDGPAVDGIFGGKRSDHRLGHVMDHASGEGLHILQSPQLYYRMSFLQALDAVGVDLPGYDGDAELYIAGGFEVAAVPGAWGNIRIVSQADLRLLTKLMGGSKAKKKDRYGGLGW
jgi:2-C-methyl-D-erythritol 4-phosphate cytidylyltransferase